METYYKILNTENNKSKGLSYGYTDTKPGEDIDFREIRLVNGMMEYHASTPIKVINVLETARFSHGKQRLMLDYGDAKTGQSWGEVYDVCGYIGNSTGKHKLPLLIHNSRSLGGPAILDHCIVKISESKGKRVLYQHPTYQPPKES